MSLNSKGYDVFRLRAEGFSVSSIAKQLSIAENEVQEILTRKPTFEQPDKSPKIHKLSQAERKKGGEISQRIRTRQRKENFERIKSMVDLDCKSVELASVIFMLDKCQRKRWTDDDFDNIKEFSIIIKNEDVGLIFLKALQHISVPMSSIQFWWCKSYSNYFGVNEVKNNWKRLDRGLDGDIHFKRDGAKEEMLLKVVAFAFEGNSVSSRALAQAFFFAGRKVFGNEAR